MTATNDTVVSFEDEPLIVVDSDDNVLDYKSKAECHDGDGILHRAFSVFLFNGEGKLLLQQRAPGKRLWGGFWSNSCCSHPRKGEEMDAAADRRVREELGLTPNLTYLFKFEYHAPFGSAGSERELCSVYVGRADGEPTVNINEISNWKWVDVAEFESDVEKNGASYTPWMKLEWPRIRGEHWKIVEGL